MRRTVLLAAGEASLAGRHPARVACGLASAAGVGCAVLTVPL